MSVPIFPICHSGVPEKSREIVLDLEVLAEGDKDGFGEGRRAQALEGGTASMHSRKSTRREVGSLLRSWSRLMDPRTMRSATVAGQGPSEAVNDIELIYCWVLLRVGIRECHSLKNVRLADPGMDSDNSIVPTEAFTDSGEGERYGDVRPRSSGR